jgi:hypothetical protein
VITASGAPYYLPERQTPDLAPVRDFGSGYRYPAAVATASTGQVAAGIYASCDPDVGVYTATAAQLHSFEFANCCGASTSWSYKYGENVTFALQVYRSGAWRRVDSDIAALDGSSIAAVGFFGTKGYHYRIRGQYGGDAVNLAQAGAWQYAQFS